MIAGVVVQKLGHELLRTVQHFVFKTTVENKTHVQ
jgi:hypothetical protein